jgi:tetratricopeptide (TPR) repeat protein
MSNKLRKLKKSKKKEQIRHSRKLKKSARQAPYTTGQMQLAAQHYRAGNLKQAEHLYRQVLSSNPDNADALNSLGNVLRVSGKPEEAILCYRNALNLQPRLAEIHANLGLALKDMDRLAEAASAFRKALRIKPGLAELYIGLGNILQEKGDLDGAIANFKKALAIKPKHIMASKNLGVALKEAGRLKEAALHFQKAIAARPQYGEAYRNLADLEKYTEYDNDVRQMEKVYAEIGPAGEDRMHLGFALGKVFEDLEQYDKAFGYLTEANRLKRQSYTYSVDADRDFFARIRDTFSPGFFSSHPEAGNPDATPVFIIGMPRSGTTLIEQILSSHPLVEGAGELMALTDIANNYCSVKAAAPYPEGVLRLQSSEFTDMGSEYLAAIRRFSEDAKHITDKMPHNFLRVGLIKAILPNAKVIHCSRDPMDTCLSIYKNYFSGKESHQYAYDLHELGTYYLLYQSLMEHWEKVLPGYMYTVKYEEMINCQREETEKLLSFCGLPWDDACLAFHRTGRRVQTASAVQVRQPIYTDSVKLWQRYGDRLEPLRKFVYGAHG